MIIVISVVGCVLAFGLGVALSHIRQINRELEALAEVNKEQDDITQKVALYARDVATAVEELQGEVMMLKRASMDDRSMNYTGPWGEA